MGIDLPPELIFTAAKVAADYVADHFPAKPRVFNLATEGIQELLAEKVVFTQNEHEPCDAVIISNPQGVYATVPRMRIALRLIVQGAACVGICADRLYPSPEGLELGSGAMTQMFAYAANVEPILFGKPQKRFFQHLCDNLGVPPAACVLIGDNLESDIGGANSMGMKTILSLTGVARRSDLAHAPPEQQPDWVVETLEEL
jgi:ribonucleotide monophosphatase NagD (HAD superfamily)